MFNILSTFNGCGCLWLALDALNVPISKRYVSEIDKYANAVQMYRYPDTLQLGDITQVTGEGLEPIHLLAGGSPCQGFSIAGKRKGFEDPRSKLFFDFVRSRDKLKPSYFLLENVKMDPDSVDLISSYLGVKPILINSSVFSAQNRKRLYWTDIPIDELPEDKGLILGDILEDNYQTEREKSLCITASYSRGDSAERYFTKSSRQLVYKPVKLGNVNPSWRGQNGNVYSTYGKSPTLTTNKGEGIKISTPLRVGTADIKGNDSIKRIYHPSGKSPCLTTMQGGNQEPKVSIDELHWRKLTPLECERLQTLPDNYTLVPWGNRMMSNSQRYKMIGNGWTVDVITFLLKNMIFV